MAGEKTVLLVEDDPELRVALRRFLEYTDPQIRIVVAASADLGLELLGSLKVDTVVSDLRMPGLDGLGFLKEVAKRAPHVHRILITAFPALPAFANVVNEGLAEGFLVKPFEPEAFLALLRRVTASGPRSRLGRIPPNP